VSFNGYITAKKAQQKKLILATGKMWSGLWSGLSEGYSNYGCHGGHDFIDWDFWICLGSYEKDSLGILVGDRFMSATKPCAALLGISQVFTGMTPKRAQFNW